MTLAEREQLEIEEMKKNSKYCWFCKYKEDILCEVRIKYMQKKYKVSYLKGLKYVLEKGEACIGPW